jgi:hypothetical protein
MHPNATNAANPFVPLFGSSRKSAMHIIDSFGKTFASSSSEHAIRRWDHGLCAALMGFGVGACAVGYLLWRPWPGLPLPEGGLWRHLFSYPSLLANTLSLGRLFPDAWFDDPAAGDVSVGMVHLRLLPACLSGGWLGWRWSKRALRPIPALIHVSGPRLLENEAAAVEAERYAAEERGGRKVPGFLRLHPFLDLSKRTWCRHVLIAGSVGSGKTQIIWPLVRQIIRRKKKLLLLDVKGDYTAAIRKATILSPWDRRSVYLDVAADICTSSAASAFASALIAKEEGSNAFFSTAAELILTGCIRTLQSRAGTRWTWADLDFLLNLSAEELAPLLEAHYIKAHPLVTAGEETAQNVRATLAAYTQTVAQLAEAFGAGLDEEGQPRPRLSLTAWAKDDYTGCPTVIVHAGPDHDDVSEDGRAIFVVLDELSTIGKVKNLASLIDKGRSKGCAVVIGVQDRAQLAATHGEHFAKALPGMVGTHVITQTQLGETRDELSAMLGDRRVLWMAPAGPDQVPTPHEEFRLVVTPADLTTRLGFRRSKRHPEGFVIRALACLGGDYLLLDWPGVAMKKKRRSHVPAAWTLPVVPTSASGDGRAMVGGQPVETSKDTAALRSVPTPQGPEPATATPAVPRPRTKSWAPLVEDVTAQVKMGLVDAEGAQ